MVIGVIKGAGNGAQAQKNDTEVREFNLRQ